MDDQFRKASNIPRSDLLKTRARSRRKLFLFVTTFNPNLPDVGRIIRKHLAILESDPKLKELFPPNSIIASFRRSKNLKELLAPSRYGPNTEREEAVEVKGCFTGLEITAGQRTMSELIWEVDRSTFCLTGQVDRSHLIVLKNKIN